MRHFRFQAILRTLPVVTAFVLLAAEPARCSEAACDACRQCIGSVIPSLFPFLVLSRLLITVIDVSSLPGKLRSGFERIFALPVAALPVFLLGLVSGFPVGASAAAELYRRGKIGKEEAERLLIVSNNAGPGFLFGTAAAHLPGESGSALFLFTMQTAVSVWLGTMLAAGERNTAFGMRPPNRPVSANPVSLLSSLPNAILSGGKAVLTVCAYVVFFSVLTVFLPESAWLRGLAELTGGILLLRPENTFALVLAAFLLGFGGLGVFCQVCSALEGSDLKAGFYLPLRILHGAVNALGSFLYIKQPVLLLPFAGALVLSSIFAEKAGKRKRFAVYWRRGESNAVPKEDRTRLCLLFPRRPR